MPSTKATFTLDPRTTATLAQISQRLGRSKSAVVREAILDYGERVGRLGEDERRRMLNAFDELVPKIPERTDATTDRELAAIRDSRCSGGRGG